MDDRLGMNVGDDLRDPMSNPQKLGDRHRAAHEMPSEIDPRMALEHQGQPLASPLQRQRSNHARTGQPTDQRELVLDSGLDVAPTLDPIGLEYDRQAIALALGRVDLDRLGRLQHPRESVAVGREAHRGGLYGLRRASWSHCGAPRSPFASLPAPRIGGRGRVADLAVRSPVRYVERPCPCRVGLRAPSG